MCTQYEILSLKTTPSVHKTNKIDFLNCMTIQRYVRGVEQSFRTVNLSKNMFD